MPFKLSVGLCRKIGLPDYGSVGASCSLEIELDPSLLASDPQALRQRIQHAYSVCQAAIDEQLASAPSNPDTTSPTGSTNCLPAGAPNGRDPPRNGQTANGQPASEKQLAYARQLAAQIRGLGVRRLDELAGRVCGKPLADLSSVDASSLIDMMKAIKAGTVDLDAALSGAPP